MVRLALKQATLEAIVVGFDYFDFEAEAAEKEKPAKKAKKKSLLKKKQKRLNKPLPLRGYTWAQTPTSASRYNKISRSIKCKALQILSIHIIKQGSFVVKEETCSLSPSIC